MRFQTNNICFVQIVRIEAVSVFGMLNEWHIIQFRHFHGTKDTFRSRYSVILWSREDVVQVVITTVTTFWLSSSRSPPASQFSAFANSNISRNGFSPKARFLKQQHNDECKMLQIALPIP